MNILIVAIFALFVFPGGAHAYLDPGTGSYVVQVVIASVAAGSYFFKDKIGGLIGTIKSKLKGKKNAKK